MKFGHHRLAAGILLAATTLLAGPSSAGTLTQTEIDAAVRQHVDVSVLRSCAANPNGEFMQRAEARDFNGDGVEEIVVFSVIYSLSKCTGLNGRQADLLIRNDKGNWQVNTIRLADQLNPLPRSDSAWPDLAAEDYSGCPSVWRHDGTGYRFWKNCSNDALTEVDMEPVSAIDETPVTREGDNGPYPVQIVDLRLFQGMPFDHNGSMMLVNPDKGMIVYAEPKKSIARTVKPGTVLFRGKPWNMDGDTAPLVLEGLAFTFKRGCDAAGYNVRGRFSLDYGRFQFELQGASPVRAKSGCDVPYYDVAGKNAKLVFDFAGE